jgi:hypothetical protein
VTLSACDLRFNGRKTVATFTTIEKSKGKTPPVRRARCHAHGEVRTEIEPFAGRCHPIAADPQAAREAIWATLPDTGIGSDARGGGLQFAGARLSRRWGP